MTVVKVWCVDVTQFVVRKYGGGSDADETFSDYRICSFRRVKDAFPAADTHISGPLLDSGDGHVG